MLTSIAIILLFGLLVGWIFSKMKLPSLLGMIIVGIVLSPHCLNLVLDTYYIRRFETDCISYYSDKSWLVFKFF